MQKAFTPCSIKSSSCSCNLVADCSKSCICILHALLATNQVQVLDAWGNATCPQDFLPFEVKVQSEAAEPDLSTYPVDDRCLRFGLTATVQGVPYCMIEWPALSKLASCGVAKCNQAGHTMPGAGHQMLPQPCGCKLQHNDPSAA